MVLNATSNNISVISWLLVLLVGETGGNYTPTCRKSLTKFITDVLHGQQMFAIKYHFGTNIS
jgi:hypothetical protein